MSINLQDVKCKSCGGTLTFFFPYKRATCEHCGANYTVEGDVDQTIAFKNNLVNVEISKIDDYPLTICKFEDRNRSSIEMENHGFHYAYCQPVIKIRPIRPDLKDIVNRLVIVSFMAFILNKSYQCNDVIIDSISDQIAINSIKKKKLTNPLNNKYNQWIKRNFEEEAQKNRESLNEALRNIENYGVQLCYTVEKNKEKEVGPYEASVEYRQFLLKIPVITPSYFLNYFGDIYDRFESLKNNEVILHISSQITKIISKIPPLALSEREMSLYVGGELVSFVSGTLDRYAYSNREVLGPYKNIDENTHIFKYNSFGMSNVEDSVTRNAIAVAIINNILGNQPSDSPLIDLHEFPFADANSNGSCLNGFYSCGSSIVTTDDENGIRIFFKYQRKVTKKFKEW